MPQPRFHRLVPALILEGPEPPSEVPESGLDTEPELDPDPELESAPPSESELLEEEELPQAARTPAARRATHGEVPVRLVAMSFSLPLTPRVSAYGWVRM